MMLDLVYCIIFFLFFFFKQKTAYEMRISDWSSDVCSSDLVSGRDPDNRATALVPPDGTRTVSRGDDGSVQVSEQTRLTGPEAVLTSPPLVEIGRAACRESVCQYV